MYGIPNMKLDKKLVEGRVALMQDEGVKFTLNADVGAGYPILALMRDFDAIVLCAGATAERKIAVPGAEREGVLAAVDYLTASTRSLLDAEPLFGVYDTTDKDVVIIGGGDTGTDCAGTAIRRGAKSVTQLEIMPKPPESRAENNPWPLWPKLFKTDYGQEEAKELFGKDPREYLTTATEITGDGRGVTGVRTVKVSWEQDGERLVPVPVDGTEQVIPADIVITAMGFTGPERALIDQMGLETDARGAVQTGQNDKAYRTSMPTVFAAGDMRRGPSLVVWAIFEGLGAADACDRYLRQRQNV